MITTVILNIIYFVVGVLISPITLLPDVSLSGSFGSAITSASGYLASFNGFIPIDTIIEIFGVSLLLEYYYLLYKIAMWVLRKVPTIN